MTPLAMHLNLQELSQSLTELHRSLLRREQQRHEQSHGPVPAARMLDMAISDPRFAWLRDLSGLIVEVDERLAQDEPIAVAEASAMRARTEERLGPGRPEVAGRLRDAVQESPEVAIGLGRLRMALAELPAREA